MISALQKCATSTAKAISSVIRGRDKSTAIINGIGYLALQTAKDQLAKGVQVTVLGTTASDFIPHFKDEDLPAGSIAAVVSEATREKLGDCGPAVTFIDSHDVKDGKLTHPSLSRAKISFIDSSRKERLEPEVWKNIFVSTGSGSDTQLVVHAATANTNNNQKSIIDPTLAITEGLGRSRKENPNTAVGLVSLSSIVASMDGFDLPYAEDRRIADNGALEIAKRYNIPGAILRLDFLEPDRRNSYMDVYAKGHSASPAEFAASSLPAPIIDVDSEKPEEKGAIALQPVLERDIISGITSDELFKREFSIISAVGPKAYDQKESVALYLKMHGKDSIRQIPVSDDLITALIANNCAIDQMKFGPAFLMYRANNPQANQAFPTDEFARLIDREPGNLEDFYEGIVIKPLGTSPIPTVIGKVFIATLKNPIKVTREVGGPFIKGLPRMLSALLKDPIRVK